MFCFLLHRPAWCFVTQFPFQASGSWVWEDTTRRGFYHSLYQWGLWGFSIGNRQDSFRIQAFRRWFNRFLSLSTGGSQFDVMTSVIITWITPGSSQSFQDYLRGLRALATSCRFLVLSSSCQELLAIIHESQDRASAGILLLFMSLSQLSQCFARPCDDMTSQDYIGIITSFYPVIYPGYIKDWRAITWGSSTSI